MIDAIYIAIIILFITIPFIIGCILYIEELETNIKENEKNKNNITYVRV